MVGALGHLPHIDKRDGLYSVRSRLEKVLVIPDYKVWARGESLDQGREGACVGFGWSNWHNAKPTGYLNQVDNNYAFNWYYRAQELDPWPGTNYEGTSVRAGAKVAAERDLLSQYLWAAGLVEVRTWLLSKGPLVVASNWYNSMDALAPGHFVQVDTNSGVRGGHCYLLYGYKDGRYYFQNSWGDGYADGGTFYMKEEDINRLIAFGQWEAVTAVQEGVA